MTPEAGRATHLERVGESARGPSLALPGTVHSAGAGGRASKDHQVWTLAPRPEPSNPRTPAPPITPSEVASFVSRGLFKLLGTTPTEFWPQGSSVRPHPGWLSSSGLAPAHVAERPARGTLWRSHGQGLSSN